MPRMTPPPRVGELQYELITLYHDLKAVNQESQATKNVFIHQKTVQKFPIEYQGKYASVSMEKKNSPGEAQWKISRSTRPVSTSWRSTPMTVTSTIWARAQLPARVISRQSW